MTRGYGSSGALQGCCAPSAVTGYVVQWRTAKASSYDPADTHTAAASATSHVIAGLDDHSRYVVQVTARNAHDADTPSQEYSALSDAPGLVVGLTAASKPGGGFTLTWQRLDPYYPNPPQVPARPVRQHPGARHQRRHRPPGTPTTSRTASPTCPAPNGGCLPPLTGHLD